MGLFDLPEVRLASLEARVAALEVGTPVIDFTPLTIGVGLRSGVAYTGSIVGGPNYVDDYGAWCEQSSGVQIIDAACKGFRFGLALWGATGMVIRSYSGNNCRIPLYGSKLIDCDLDDLALYSDSVQSTDHAIYLSAGCADVRGTSWQLEATAGYALHLYCEQGSSEGLEIDGLYMDARAGLYPAVIHNWANVRLSQVESHSQRAHYNLWDCRDVVVDSFTAKGGDCLVNLAGGRHAENVVFRNGTFDGPRLTDSDIPGVVFENVRLI